MGAVLHENTVPLKVFLQGYYKGHYERTLVIEGLMLSLGALLSHMLLGCVRLHCD